MPVEVKVLGYAALLQVLQFLLMAIPANLQLGTGYTLGPRDEQQLPSGVPGRLQRALNNHFEGLILFTIAVVLVVLGSASTALTVGCAWAYLAARILYVPAYAAGIPVLRSLIWAVGFLATVVMLVSALI